MKLCPVNELFQSVDLKLTHQTWLTVSSIHRLSLMAPQQPRKPMTTSTAPTAIST